MASLTTSEKNYKLYVKFGTFVKMTAAPAKASGGMQVAGCNYVGQDQIWKDHVLHEKVAAKDWPSNWDFLTTKPEDLVKNDFPNRGKRNTQLPEHMLIPPVTPLEERVKVYPTDKPVPKTTSAMIGWRSTEKKLTLEKYGKYAKGKGGLVKQLGWPMEGIN